MKSAFLSLLNRQTFSHPSNAAETAYEAFTDHTDDYSVRTVSSDYEGFIRRYPEAFREGFIRRYPEAFREVRNLFHSDRPDPTYNPSDWF